MRSSGVTRFTCVLLSISAFVLLASAPVSTPRQADSFSPPITFIENKGQFPPQVRFQIRIHNQIAWLTQTSIFFYATERTREPASDLKKSSIQIKAGRSKMVSFVERFVGPESPVIVGTTCSGPKFSFFVGDQSHWRTGIQACSGVLYRNLWPGIDLKLYSKDGSNLEQEFVVHPSADLSQVRVHYDGVKALKTTKQGALRILTTGGTLTETPPIFYLSADRSHPISGHFKLVSLNEYGFEIDSGLPNKGDLVVDPALLYSTFAGGSGQDTPYGIAADNAGNAYVTGSTFSQDFPLTVGSFPNSCTGANSRISGCSSAFIMKFDPAGNLVYATFLGSTYGGDFARGIAVNSNSEAYVTGSANPGFPLTQGSIQNYCYSSTFLSKLNASGDSLIYSECYGQNDIGYPAGGSGVAVDSIGVAYIAGAAIVLPITANAYQKVNKSQGNPSNTTFVMVVDTTKPGKPGLVYSSFLGGLVSLGATSGAEEALAVAVDAKGHAYIAGATSSMDFPTTPGAFQRHNNRTANCGDNVVALCMNAFVAEFDPKQTGDVSLVYSSLIGGSNYGGSDVAAAVAVDSNGQAYITGVAGSSNFPSTPGAFAPTQQFGKAFVAKFDPTKSGPASLVYSTFIPGAHSASGIAVDAAGNAYVAGNAEDNTLGFQVTPDAYQPVDSGGDFDPFLLELNASGSALIYSTYLSSSGTDFDGSTGIARDSSGNIYLTGTTINPLFPTTLAAFQTWLRGGTTCFERCTNGFIVKFGPGGSQPLTILGAGPEVGGNTGTITVTVVGSGFVSGAAVALQCPSGNVVGSNPAINPGGTRLTAVFNLNGINPGKCSVIVTDPNSSAATLQNAFTVEQGGSPMLWVDIIGPAEVPGAEGTTQFSIPYVVVVGNRGIVDAPVTRVWAAFGAGYPWTLQMPPVSAQGQEGGYQFVAFDAPVPAGGTVLGLLTISFPGFGTYEVQAWRDAE